METKGLRAWFLGDLIDPRISSFSPLFGVADFPSFPGTQPGE